MARSAVRSTRDIVLSILLLVLILALAAGLRFYNLDGQSLWSDEGNSAALATRSLAEIARTAAADIHPPLYYWLLHLWVRVAGASEAGLRSLSALLGVLLVLVIAGLGRSLYNRTTGLAAAFIAALAPFQVYYSQETRMYLLLALEAALAALLFRAYVAEEDRRLPAGGKPGPARLRLLSFTGQALVLIWVAGLYTHYLFPLIIALLSVIYLGWVIGTWRRGAVIGRLARWMLLLLLAAGLYAPWLAVALRQIGGWPTGSGTSAPGTVLQTSLAMLALGPAERDWAGAWWMWLLPALAAAGALPWPSDSRTPDGVRASRLRWLGWLLPLAWVLAPIAAMLVFGLFRDAYLKFLLIASPAFSLLLARGSLVPFSGVRAAPTAPLAEPEATPGQPRARGWLVGLVSTIWTVSTLALVGGLSGAALSRYYTDARVARDDYRGITQFIIATAGPNDAILLDAPGQIEVFNYYYQGDLPIFPLPRQRPLDPKATEQELAQLLDHDKVYALYWASEEADPERLIADWVDNRGYKTLDQWHGNVRLAVYVMPERRPPDESMDGLNLHLGSDIVLMGYRGWNLAPSAGQVTQVQLLWRTERTPQQRYKVFLQLLDGRDQVIAQRDAEPAGESRLTTTWAPGEVILDNHGLLIPPGTPPGTFRRIIGMYDPATGERLRLPDGSDHINLPPISVLRATVAPPLDALNMRYAQSFDFGGITLLGHDRYKRGFGHLPDTPINPGDRLHVTLYWRANVEPRADWWFDLTLSDNAGHTVAHLMAPLVSETYLTTLWGKGEVVRGEHDLMIPADLPPAIYRLSLIMLPDEVTQAGTAYLGTVKVGGSAGR